LHRCDDAAHVLVALRTPDACDESVSLRGLHAWVSETSGLTRTCVACDRVMLGEARSRKGRARRARFVLS
ncbi:MAG: hypothetical protein ACK2VD_07710, partial [Anaerolineae bacterium]